MLRLRIDNHGIPYVTEVHAEGLPTETPRPELRARHEKFLRNRRRTLGEREAKKKVDDEEGTETETDTDNESSMSRTSTKSTSSSSTSTLSPTSRNPTLDATTTSSTVSLTPSPAADVTTTPSTASLTQSSSSSPAPTTLAVTTTSSLSTSASAADSSTTVPTTTNAQSTLIVPARTQSVKAATRPSATGLGTTGAVARHKPISKPVLAGIVFGVVIGVVLIVLGLWYLVHRQRQSIKRELRPSPSKRYPSDDPIPGDDVSSYIPAFVLREKLRDDPERPNDASESRLERGFSQNLRPSRQYVPPPPPLSRENLTAQTMMGEEGYVRAPSRWFKRDSMASTVARFMDVRTWAGDQKTRMTEGRIEDARGRGVEVSKWSDSGSGSGITSASAEDESEYTVGTEILDVPGEDEREIGPYEMV